MLACAEAALDAHAAAMATTSNDTSRFMIHFLVGPPALYSASCSGKGMVAAEAVFMCNRCRSSVTDSNESVVACDVRFKRDYTRLVSDARTAMGFAQAQISLRRSRESRHWK